MRKFWAVLRMKPTKERHVMTEIDRMLEGDWAYCPLEVRSHAVSSKTKRRVITTTPLLTRAIFVPLMRDLVEDMTKIRYVTGFMRAGDEQGLIWSVSDRQFQRFRSEHEAWFKNATESHRRGEQGRSKSKAKFKTFSELKAHFAQEESNEQELSKAA